MPYHIEPHYESWMIVRDQDGAEIYHHDDDQGDLLKELHRLETFLGDLAEAADKVTGESNVVERSECRRQVIKAFNLLGL